METNLKNGGETLLDTASTDSQNQKPDISSTPRMLTRSEIESLRRSKKANNAWMAAQDNRLPDSK
jgi:hypothetical protein